MAVTLPMDAGELPLSPHPLRETFEVGTHAAIASASAEFLDNAGGAYAMHLSETLPARSSNCHIHAVHQTGGEAMNRPVSKYPRRVQQMPMQRRRP